MAVVSRGKKMFANGGLESVGQIVIPTGEARAEVTLASEEGDVVEVAIADILQPLYDTTNPLIAAGAQYWSGLNSEVKIPYINKGLVTWEGETAAAGDAGVAFGSTTFAPKRLTAYVDISKALLSVDSVGVENAIIAMLGSAIQDKVVATVLGTDDSNGNTRPEGLGYGKSFDNLADFKAFCKKEADLQKEGFNDLTYIMSPSAKAFARTLTMNKGTRNVMEGNDFDGTKTITTYNVPDGKLYVGSFKDLVICTFGAVDLVVDNIS